jgi:cytochrome subunit of sulfide dehydrogenase
MIRASLRILTGAACGAVFAIATALPAAAADVNKIVESCANCHGKDGASTEADVPTIAGYSAAYLAESMNTYKKKERPCPETKYRAGDKKGQQTDMCKTVANLSDADVKAVAGYFAGKKFVRAKQSFDPALAKKGKELHEFHCEKCHSDGGSVADDDAGILAGQHKGYLAETFKEYTSGKRPMPEKMKPKIEKLDKANIDELVNYYASFQ